MYFSLGLIIKVVQTMSETAIAQELLEYGLAEPESRIYVYLAKKGTSPAGEIAKALNIRRGQTYNILKGLQEKGIVEAVASKPTKFSALPLQKALIVLIEAQRQRQHLMERLRPELLSMWQSVLPAGIEEVQEEKYQFLKGVESIYRKASEIIDSSDSNIVMVAPERALYQTDRLGVIDRMNRASKRNVNVKVLAEITPRTTEIAKRLKNINTRQLIEHSPPHFLIVDEEQIIFLTNPMESVSPREVNAMWTNGPILVRSMQRLFEDMWSAGKLEGMAVTPELEKRPLVETKEQRVEILQEEFAKCLKASGFEVKKDHALVGESGTKYVFSLALFRNTKKPIVIDFILSNEPITSVRVIEFFVKRLDVGYLVADTTLVVRPGLDKEAKKLAAFYRIKFNELG
jgi:sugar-specific transcriptional regulator TrmB